jgi:hypothetical protein
MKPNPGAQGFSPKPVPGEIQNQVLRQSRCIAQAPMSAREIPDGPCPALGAQEDGSVWRWSVAF